MSGARFIVSPAGTVGEVIRQTPGYPPMLVGMSTNDYTDLLPKQRWSHEAQGKVLLFPRTGDVLVPYEMARGGGWYCVVVHEGGNASAKVGGYNLYVGDREVETAIELEVKA